MKERIARLALRKKDDEVRLQRELFRLDAETARLVDLIRMTEAGSTALAPVKAALEKAPAEQESVRRQLAVVQTAKRPVKLPTADEISEGVLNIEGCIHSARTR